LRARPEPTLLEDPSNASFLGKLLVLPANVKLDWKVIASYKHSSLFGLDVSNEEKKFYNIDTSGLYYKSMTIVNDNSGVINELEDSLTVDSRVVIYDRLMFIVQATGRSENVDQMPRHIALGILNQFNSCAREH
jgi:hypothetical protein